MNIHSIVRTALGLPASIFKTLLSIGTNNGTHSNTHITRVVNLVALITLPLIILNVNFYVSDLGLPAYLIHSYYCVAATVYASTILWNHLHFHSFAKLWMFVFFVIDVFLSTQFIIGTQSQNQWHLLLSIPLAFFFWSRHDQVTRYLVIAISILAFIVFTEYAAYEVFKFTSQQVLLLNLTVFFDVAIMNTLAAYLFSRESQRYRNELRQLAMFDSLTNVLCRREFEQRIEKYLATLKQQSNFALILIDVDDFKQINDEYGHAAGDKALIHLASILSACSDGEVGRLGGDEFSLFLEAADKKVAVNIVTSLLHVLKNKPLYFEGSAIPISVSIGIACETQRRSLDRIFALADDALYRTKRTGKGSFQLSKHRQTGIHPAY